MAFKELLSPSPVFSPRRQTDGKMARKKKAKRKYFRECRGRSPSRKGKASKVRKLKRLAASGKKRKKRKK
jgi:hypothetical protein